MVRVWYEPPPYGPGTDLNRSAYGFHGESPYTRRLVERFSKMPQMTAIGGCCAAILVICWIPVSTSTASVTVGENARPFPALRSHRAFAYSSSIIAVNPKLPFSMDPEYQAASRAYMRYHNMNPIFGISSKYVRLMSNSVGWTLLLL